jgi:hypothetical protein
MKPFDFFAFLGLCCHFARMSFAFRVLGAGLGVDPWTGGPAKETVQQAIEDLR